MYVPMSVCVCVFICPVACVCVDSRVCADFQTFKLLQAVQVINVGHMYLTFYRPSTGLVLPDRGSPSAEIVASGRFQKRK